MNYESLRLNVSATHISDNVSSANLTTESCNSCSDINSGAFSFVGKAEIVQSYVSYLMHLCDKLCCDKVFVDDMHIYRARFTLHNADAANKSSKGWIRAQKGVLAKFSCFM